MKKFLAILMVLVLVIPCAALGETKATPSLVLTGVVTAARESNDTAIVKLSEEATDICMLMFIEDDGTYISIPGLGTYGVYTNESTVFATAIVALVIMCGTDDYGVTWGVAYGDNAWTEEQVVLMATETAKIMAEGD